MTKTTEELVQALYDEQNAWAKGDRRLESIDTVFEAGMWSKAKADLPDCGLVKMAQMMEKGRGEDGARSMINCVLGYHAFRDEVQAYQAENKISSIVWRSQLLCGKVISYPESHDQLVCLDSDLIVLRQWVTQIAKSFLDAAIDYDLTLSLSEDEHVPATSNEVMHIAERSDWAWIYSTSVDWGEPAEDGSRRGHFVDRDPPDEIMICLGYGYPSDSGNGFYFKAFRKNTQQGFNDVQS